MDQNSGNLYLYPHGEPDNFFIMLSITPAGDSTDEDMHDETFQKEFMAEFEDGFQDYNLISTDSGEWKGKNIFTYECQGSEQGMALTIHTTMFLHNGNMYSVGLLSDEGITGADRASLDAFLAAIELHDDDVDPSLPGMAPSAVGGGDAISAAFPEIVESDDASLDKLHALAEASFEQLVDGLPEGMQTIQSIGWLADDEGTAAVGVYLQLEPNSSSANAMAASLLYDIRTFDEEQAYDGDVFVMYMMHTSQFDKAVAVGGYNAEELTVYYVDLNRSLVGSFTCGPDEIEDRMKEVGY